MTRWMQSLNFAAMTIGNHEFDWGTDVLKQNAAKYSLPILGINIIDKTTGKRADYVQPSTIIYRGGAKIGIIGAIGDCYSSISYSKVMDVEFILDKEGEESKPLTNLIKAESTRLRNEENCDFIVYSFHGDSYHNDTYYNPELSTGHYVDVVLEGHKHLETYYQDDGNVWHFQSQAGNDELAINHFTVNLNVSTNAYELSFDSVKDIYYMNQADKKALANDRATMDLIYSYNFAPYYNKIGYNSSFRSGQYLRQLCANLYLQKGIEKWPELADQIVLGGGYISIRGDGYLPIGDVNYSQFYNLFPFDNDIMLIKLKGSYLKSGFINNTNTNYFLSYTSYGLALRDDQTQILDDNWYYLVVDTYGYDYIIQYNPDKVTDEGHYSTTGFYARDCMAEYAAAGGFYVEAPEIETTGAYDNPYSVADALTICGTDPTWGYAKGIVVSVEALVDNYLQNVVIADLNDNTKTMNIYKLHRHDNDKDEDDNLMYGFTDASELPVGSEIIIYGAFKENSYGKQFGSVNMLISINGAISSGTSAENPTSVINYIQSITAFELTKEIYAFGKVRGTYFVDDNLNEFVLYGYHNVDYNRDWVAFYDDAVLFSNEYTFTFAAGLSQDNVVNDAKVVVKVDVTNKVVHFVQIVPPVETVGPFVFDYNALSGIESESKSVQYGENLTVTATGSGDSLVSADQYENIQFLASQNAYIEFTAPANYIIYSIDVNIMYTYNNFVLFKGNHESTNVINSNFYQTGNNKSIYKAKVNDSVCTVKNTSTYNAYVISVVIYLTPAS